MATWTCSARGCDKHQSPQDKCRGKTWVCGRLVPPCETHRDPDDKCRSGTLWHCGAIGCATHTGRSDRCVGKAWLCGRTSPSCPSHRNHADRCEPGAFQRLWITLNGSPLAARIIGVLNSSHVDQISVRLFGTVVRGSDFRAIARAIERHRVHLIGILSDNIGVAYYHPGANAIIVTGESFLSSDRDFGLLVHETAHAINDMKRVPLSGTDDEIIAYVAQLMYQTNANLDGWGTISETSENVVRRAQSAANTCVLNGSDQMCASTVQLAAYSIARDLRSGREPPRSLIADMRRVLPIYRPYRDRDMNEIIQLDGVGAAPWR